MQEPWIGWHGDVTTHGQKQQESKATGHDQPTCGEERDATRRRQDRRAGGEPGKAG